MRIFNSLAKKDQRRELRRKATLPERLLWNYLRQRSFGYKFRKQHSIGQYVVDFYCPKLKLAVEVDGSHHWRQTQRNHDELRTRYLRSLGVTVIRYPALDALKNTEGVIESIERRCRTLATPPPAPPL